MALRVENTPLKRGVNEIGKTRDVRRQFMRGRCGPGRAALRRCL